MQNVPFLTYILFIIGFSIYIFILLLINGKLFGLYSQKGYQDYYINFWRNMTNYQRLVLTETYYRFYLYFKEELEKIKKEKNNSNIEIQIKYLESNYIRNNSKYLNVPYILVSLIPSNQNNNNTKKLLVCSHFDGHNLTKGGTAYDDAIHVASMLGTIKTLTINDKKLNTQVDFLFDGAEEYGLIGAKQYAEYLKNNSIKENYDYLNLESMGGAPPYGFVIKNNNGNYRIQKALSKTTGSILMASNYIYATKFTSSSTDHIVFDQQEWKGGVSVFLGKGSVYHSKYDEIEEEEHLRIAGNQLINFVLNYEKEGYEGNSVGYGIAPICIVLPILFFYISIPIIFIVSVIVIILKERKEIKNFLIDLLKQFICFIIVLAIFLIEGLLVYLINSNSPAANQIFVGLISLSGLFLFLLFQRIFKIQKWSRFRLILDSILMMICITTDLSLPFLLLTIFSIIFYAFDNKITKFICGIFQVIVMSLFFTFLIQIFMQYTTRFSEIIGNLVLFFIFFIYSYHISVSPLEFHEVNVNENLIDMVNNIYNSTFSNEKEQILNEDVNDNVYNINDYLNEDNKVKNNNNNRLTKKKLLPIYLMILYILYCIILLIVLFFKPYPYSKNYTVRGTFLNIFKNKRNSTMIFQPLNGYSYAKKYIKNSKFKNSFREEDLKNYLNNIYEGKSFVVDSKDIKIGFYNNKCRIVMPDLDFSEIIKQVNNSDGTFNYTFNFNIPNTTCIDIIYIYIHCKDCIKLVNGMNYTKSSNFYHDMILRVGKKNIINEDLPDFEINTEFTLNTDNFDYTVLLNTMKNTKEYIEFLESFGEASCNTKSTLVTDTIFKYEGSYPIKNKN